MKHILHKVIVVFCLFMFGSLNMTGQTLKSYDQIGQMILQNQTSLVNPTYNVPKGTVNTNCYFTSAIAGGDAVQKPLSYFVSSAPTNYYVNYSLTSALCERGKTFQLSLITNKNLSGTTTAYAYAFADWNRDGVFETVLGKSEISDLSTKETPGVSYTVAIPETADLGKTRIRVYLTTTNLTTVNPTDILSSGYIYDFVLFTTENTGTATTALVAVSSNNTSWGTAIVKTESPTSDGRYPIGTNVTLEAIPANNLTSFVGWSNGTSIISTEKNYTFSVTAPVYLIAMFKSIVPVLSAPQASTAEAPVWYQIKNAQTDSRLNCFICYDGTLKIQKPEDTSDKFLWRLESVENNKVKIVNKGSNKKIYSATGALNEVVTVSDTGSDFLIQTSGNANGSYSVMLNGNSASLLNGGTSLSVLIYNAGVGTGSGWYFYKVPSELLNTGISEEYSQIYKIFPRQDNLCFEGLDAGTQVTVYNMLGHSVMKCNIESEKHQEPFSLKGAFVALIKSKSGKISICKFIR